MKMEITHKLKTKNPDWTEENLLKEVRIKIKIGCELKKDPYWTNEQKLKWTGMDEKEFDEVTEDVAKPNNENRVKKYFLLQMLDLLLRGYTPKEIKRFFCGIDQDEIKKTLKEYNNDLVLSNRKLKHVRKILTKGHKPLCSRLRQTIIGTILGHCSIISRSKEPNGQNFEKITKAIDFLDRLRHLAEKIQIEGVINDYINASRILAKTKTASLQMDIEDEIWRQHRNYILSLDNYEYSDATIDLYDIYQQFFPNDKKTIPKNLELTPLIIFHCFIDCGDYKQNRITLNTQGFSYEDNKLLQKKLQNIGISTEILPSPNNKDRHVPVVTGKKSVDHFFDYISRVPSDDYFTAKFTFPWKFYRHLWKKDVLEA